VRIGGYIGELISLCEKQQRASHIFLVYPEYQSGLFFFQFLPVGFQAIRRQLLQPKISMFLELLPLKFIDLGSLLKAQL
jgi:hypothetical protein